MSDQAVLWMTVACSVPGLVVFGLLFWPRALENPIGFDDPPVRPERPEPPPRELPPDVRVLTMRELAAVLEANKGELP